MRPTTSYRTAVIVLAVLLHSGQGLAQGGWAFRDRAYYEPLLTEPRAARIQLVVPSWSDEFEFQEKPGGRFTWQITLGRELPIAGWESAPLGNESRPKAGEWGFGLWVPVSFHMIEDFKDPSNPIINTDMRFGFTTKTQIGLGNEHTLGFRLTPWAHESTHLGDEFSISAARRHPDFERINVSYEYYEYGISLEGPRITIRHGGITPWGDDGYYSSQLLAGQGGRVIPVSKANYEPSIGVEYRFPEWRGRHTFVSTDARWRTIYDYRRPSADCSEARQWSFSLSVGRVVPPNTAGTPLKAYFFHFYHGVNPHGQFRSQRDYTFFGVGLTFDR